ncbi:hypothetical protein NQ314_016186 [Rhamnusium bicolor]|uniref:Uncharacterized protein n=1 Tax=Rhamnusium bicolor TaxID=1586634 RepID=A0AAV8WXP8_9CUCU|nr:hypothetical protein NQ314_016186 [Rhamnusium bicolor]
MLEYILLSLIMSFQRVKRYRHEKKSRNSVDIKEIHFTSMYVVNITYNLYFVIYSPSNLIF